MVWCNCLLLFLYSATFLVCKTIQNDIQQKQVYQLHHYFLVFRNNCRYLCWSCIYDLSCPWSKRIHNANEIKLWLNPNPVNQHVKGPLHSNAISPNFWVVYVRLVHQILEPDQGLLIFPQKINVQQSRKVLFSHPCSLRRLTYFYAVPLWPFCE